MSRDLKDLLGRLSVRPNKALGQNFLTDPSAAAAIVADLGAGVEDTVVEIGPGVGALSEHLAGKVKRLVLVEFDRKLAAHLEDRFGGVDGVEVLHQDATAFDLRPLFAEGEVKVIGNLPYSCGGEILRRFLDPPSPVSKAVFMLQKEVVERLQAEPRTKSYGRMTLLVRAFWEVEQTRVLGPEPFYPRPAVDSAVMRMTRRPAGESPPFDWKIFERLLRVGFGQRRKQLKRRLPLDGRDWEQVCAELGFSETARAEELSLDDWIRLARLIDPHPLKDNPQEPDEMFDVVDEHDVTIGQRTRCEVHREGLLHRAVHIFVFNPKGELFLQKRSSLKDSSPGLWGSSASGHLDVGEEYLAATHRELGEELGIDGEPEEIATLPPSEATGWEFVRLFQLEHKGPFTWPCSEVEAGLFFAPEVIADWLRRRPQDFAEGFRECWQAYLAP